MEFIRASEAVIPVHQARSHDEFWSPDLNFTIYAAMTIVSQMEGSKVSFRDVCASCSASRLLH